VTSLFWFCGATDKLNPAWFWGQTVAVILRSKSTNRSCRFWGPNRETHRPWFWGSTKKSALLASMCIMQTTHSITWPLDHLADEYPTCAWSSPVLCTRSSNHATIFVAVHHVTPVTYTSRDKQMRFFTNQDKGKNHWNVPDSNSNLAMSMIYHNQTKELTTSFLNLPLDESIDTKRHKVWISNPRPHEAHLKDQRPRKAQKYHLEEGKAARPTKGTKSGKTNQNDKEERGKAQKHKKLTKLKNSPPESNSP
jgi:hypothetical protein